MGKWAWGLTAGTVLAAAVAAVLVFRPEPTGKAVGSREGPSSSAVALWTDLARFERSHLQAFSDSFGSAPADDLEVLNAVNELMVAVTGPGGLWRKTVPTQFFGCENDAESSMCRRLAEENARLSEWDVLQEQLMLVETEKAAARFLKKKGERIRAYIDTFVPQDGSFSAIRATPFFADNLASALTGPR